MTVQYTKALEAAAKFHSLAAVAANNGGFWVSSAGGTANVAAGEIAKGTGASFQEAHRALDTMGAIAWESDDWYNTMAHAQPWCPHSWDDDNIVRWDVRTIARAAVRAVR